MSKAKAVAAPEEAIEENVVVWRAVDPDEILEGEYETVKFGYKQPAGVYADTQKEQSDSMLDKCLVWVTGVQGIEALREKKKPWSKILPPRLANHIYVILITAYRLTEAEAEG